MARTSQVPRETVVIRLKVGLKGWVREHYDARPGPSFNERIEEMIARDQLSEVQEYEDARKLEEIAFKKKRLEEEEQSVVKRVGEKKGATAALRELHEKRAEQFFASWDKASSNKHPDTLAYLTRVWSLDVAPKYGVKVTPDELLARAIGDRDKSYG